MYYCMGGGVCQALFLRRQTDATKRGGESQTAKFLD